MLWWCGSVLFHCINNRDDKNDDTRDIRNGNIAMMIEMERNIIGVKMIGIRENDGINRGRNRKNTLQ